MTLFHISTVQKENEFLMSHHNSRIKIKNSKYSSFFFPIYKSLFCHDEFILGHLQTKNYRMRRTFLFERTNFWHLIIDQAFENVYLKIVCFVLQRNWEIILELLVKSKTSMLRPTPTPADQEALLSLSLPSLKVWKR